MKIFLANPPCKISIDAETERFYVRAGSRWPFSMMKKKNQKPSYVTYPFYLAYTSSLLQENGFDVDVCDGVALDYSEKKFLKRIEKSSPDLLLFETATPTIYKDFELAKAIKERLPKIKIALSGAHVTVFPKETLGNEFVDFVMLNEYELNFLELAKRLENGKGFEGMMGIGYKENGKIRVVPNNSWVDLSKLPFPDRKNFPETGKGGIDYYWDGFCTYRPAAQMHSSRGCPFKCNFCLWNQVMYRCGPYRFFEPKKVVDEMEILMNEYRAREIYFDDDTFTGNKQNVLNLCKEIGERIPKARFSLMGDFMISDEEMIRALHDAGCIGMKFGVESADANILKGIGKPIDFKRIRKNAKLCAELGIKTHATFTFGLFGETKKTMHKTLDFAKELDSDTIQVSITTPFPGTGYYEEAKKRNLLITEDWRKYDGSSSSVVKFENLTHEEVENFACKAYDDWLRAKKRDPRWLLRQARYSWRQIEGRGIRDFIRRVVKVVRT